MPRQPAGFRLTVGVRVAIACTAVAGTSPLTRAANADPERTDALVESRKHQLNDQFFSEGATFADLNRDGHADAVAGPFWYEGPEFKRRHELYAPVAFDPLQYSDNFFAAAHDFNGDGWLDVLVIGFPGKEASWLEHPGTTADAGGFQRHDVFAPVDNESPTFGDLTGDGRPELICSSGGRFGHANWDAQDPALPWTFHPISPPGPWHRFTHGLGFGDVNGDGRADLLERGGWWEQPASLDGDPVWIHHPVDFGPGGAQMYATDVNGDGHADVITARVAHGYGLSWFEQEKAADGSITFREHAITASDADVKLNGVQFSQPHALALADIDGDGLRDVVTGKRWWAHGPTGDPEPNAAAVIYAFLLRRGADGATSFVPHRIDDSAGVGTQLVAQDINGDGRADVISGNKLGTFVFLSSPSADPRRP